MKYYAYSSLLFFLLRILRFISIFKLLSQYEILMAAMFFSFHPPPMCPPLEVSTGQRPCEESSRSSDKSVQCTTHQFKCSWFVCIRECVRGVELSHLDFSHLDWLVCFSHSISSFKTDPVSCFSQKGWQKIAQESPIESTSGYPQVAGPQWTSFQALGSLGGSRCLFVLCLYYSSASDNTDISLIM